MLVALGVFLMHLVEKSYGVSKMCISTPDGLAYYTGMLNGGGLQHGRGSYVVVKGRGSYEGTFVDGQREGYGKLILIDGYGTKEYVGEWMCDKRSGFGMVGLSVCLHSQ